MSSACDFKSHFCKQREPRSEEQSDQGPHCLPVCKNRFEKSARIFSRRHKQTFSDTVFLSALRVKAPFTTAADDNFDFSFIFQRKQVVTFHLNFLRSFFPFCCFKKGSCQFLAKECAQYWLTT